MFNASFASTGLTPALDVFNNTPSLCAPWTPDTTSAVFLKPTKLELEKIMSIKFSTYQKRDIAVNSERPTDLTILSSIASLPHLTRPLCFVQLDNGGRSLQVQGEARKRQRRRSSKKKQILMQQFYAIFLMKISDGSMNGPCWSGAFGNARCLGPHQLCSLPMIDLAGEFGWV